MSRLGRENSCHPGWPLIAVLVALLLMPAPAPAQSGEDASPQREGWLLGLVLGRGAGDFSASDGPLSLSSEWSSGGKVVRGRLGRALTPDLVLTAEYGTWRREVGSDGAGGSESVENAPIDRYLGSGIVAVNLYPKVGGFLLRAGLGYGRGLAEIRRPEGTVRNDAKGPLLLLGFGYEWFLDRDLSIVAGADFGRIEAGEELSGNFAQFTVSFQGYLRDGLPREWF